MQHVDEDEFTEFVRVRSASLFRTAYLMTGDYQQAEDVLQGALVKVYQHWPHVMATGRPEAYARRVVVNQAASWWRKRSSHELALVLRDEPSWDRRLEGVPEHELVWQAVLRLPRRQRAVTVLRYYEDMSEAQIAQTLGMAPGTVKSTAHKASRRLAELLGEPVPETAVPREATS